MNLRNINLFMIVLMAVVSCNSDDNLDLKTVGKTNDYSAKVSYDAERNILKFSGLKSSVESFLSDTIADKNSMFTKFYKKGFLPLSVSPEIKDENLYNKIQQKTLINIPSHHAKNGSEEEDSETFLEDEEFASLLNSEGALQLNDSIYMYTPNGLFIVHKDDYDSLEDFIEENQEISIPEGMNYVSDKIISYRPNLEELGSEYDIVDRIAPDEPGSGGGGGGTTITIPKPNQTSHYTNCNNGINTPFVGNIFGKQYVCYYNFSSKYRVKTVFEIQDFFLFYSVRAKNKFRKKGWTGIWGREDAKKLYLRINNGVMKVERKTFTATVSDSQLKPLINSINNLITVKSAPIPVVSDVYLLENSGKFKQQNYSLSQYDLNSFSPGNPLVPQYSQNLTSVNMDSFKNLLNTNKKAIIYINLFNKDREITLDQIMNIAAKVFQKYATQGRTNNDIAVFMNEIKASHDRIDAKPFYIVTKDELIQANNTHKVIKDFGVRKDFDLKGFEIGFTSNANGDNKWKFKFTLGHNKITQYKMDIEGGVYYNRWGGTRFTVEKS